MGPVQPGGPAFVQPELPHVRVLAEEGFEERGPALGQVGNGLVPLQGGVPIEVDGQVVGAVGVSGASSADEDRELALIGAQAVAALEVTA